MRNINVQTIKVERKQFFSVWLQLLQPFLKLRDQELTVLASLLYYRYVIHQQVKSKTMVDELLFNTRTRKQIREELDIKNYSFNNILSALRKKGLIVNNTLNQKIVPILDTDEFDNFKLVYNIEVK
jgi:DNA-binding MarR family transcriptional regulator